MVVFGVDFGTTFSSVCVFNSGRLHVFKQQNSAYIPTFLFLYSDTMAMSFGYDAETASLDPNVKGGFFRDLKRWVGCDETNIEEYKSKLKPHYSVNLSNFGKGSRKIPTLGSYSGSVQMSGSLSGLIALFIQALVKSAAIEFKCECTGLIVSVPANYDCMQRLFTENCVNLSGFTCVHMMNEPSAAALSTCGRTDMSARNLLVYDFGGGTFDVSVLSSLNQTFTVRASGGDMNLGGRDVDRAFKAKIYQMANLPFDEETDISSLKESLSKVDYPITYTIKTKDGESRTVVVSRGLLAEVIVPFVDRTVKVMKRVFELYVKNMNLKAQDAKASLVLVGGSSYLPGLKSLLQSVDFVSECIDLPDPRAAVAAGCALYSSCLSSESPMLLVDCASHNLSIPNYVGESIVLVPAGAPVPFVGTRDINLASCVGSGSYSPVLFEGDRTKCFYNKKVFSGTVPLKDLGVTGDIPRTIRVTLATEVSSVGTVKFTITGPSAKKVLVGGVPAYDFSKESVSLRSITELHTENQNRVLLALTLTKNREARQKFSYSEKQHLDSLSGNLDTEKESKKFNGYNEQTADICRILLGKSVQKTLRGARVEELSY